MNPPPVVLQPMTAAAEAWDWLRLMKKSFAPLLEQYKDYTTNPCMETVEHTRKRLEDPYTAHYWIQAQGVNPAGGIRIRQMNIGGLFKLSCLFLHPDCQNLGYGRQAVRQVEALYPHATAWTLDTILQDERNNHFYQSLGYRRTGEPQPVNERMSLVVYEK